MQKLIVFSDIHGKINILDYLKQKYPNDVKICLGDCEMNQEMYEAYIKDILFLRGNSDIHLRTEIDSPYEYDGIKILKRSSNNLVPTEILIECEKMKICLCHGHLIVKDANEYRKEKNADLLLIGHSHHFVILLDSKDVTRVINPGCSNSNKVRDMDANWEKKPPSYIELTIENGKIVDLEKIEYPKELW